MPLRLIAGPANAGKVELLLDRYLAALDSPDGVEPVLIVPNVADVNRVELELLARSPALLGGSIGTFDDLFRRLAAGSTDARRQLGRVEQALLVRRVVNGAKLDDFARSAAHTGFVDSLERALDELDEGLLVAERRGRRARRSLRGLPRRARPARALGSRPACAVTPSSASGPISTPGAASRSSPTASRI